MSVPHRSIRQDHAGGASCFLAVKSFVLQTSSKTHGTDGITYSGNCQSCLPDLAKPGGILVMSIIRSLPLEMPPRRKLLVEDLPEQLGLRLARLRKERGITQEELAAQLHLSQANVSDYERGRLRLHADVIIELTRILDVSADELLGIERKPRASQAQDRRVLQRLRLIDNLPKRDKDAVLRMIGTMASGARTRNE